MKCVVVLGLFALTVCVLLDGTDSKSTNVSIPMRTKRGVGAIVPSVLGPVKFLLKTLGYEKTLSAVDTITGAVMPWLSPDWSSMFSELKQDLAYIRNSLNWLSILIKEQAVQNVFVNADIAISHAMNTLDFYLKSPGEAEKNNLLRAASPMRLHVEAIFKSILQYNIIETLGDIYHCRTRTIEQRVGELIKLVASGMIVDDVHSRMTNDSMNNFIDYVQNVTDQVEKRLDEKLDKCRALISVSSQIQRIIAENARENRPKVLEEVFGFLRDRYDKHDWLVLVYDSSDSRQPQSDLAFYKVETTTDFKHSVMALPVLRASGVSDRNQARNWIIDRLCPENRHFKRPVVFKVDINFYDHQYYSTKRIADVLGKDMHFATYANGKAMVRHSANMDIAKWPHRSEKCILGNGKEVLLAVAPSYRILRDPVPSIGMALMNRQGYALTARDQGSIRVTKYTGKPGQHWRFVDNQLQNDLGLCAAPYLKMENGRYTNDPPHLIQVPCPSNHWWQLDNMRLTNLVLGSYGVGRALDITIAAIIPDFYTNELTEWYFSPDGSTRYKEQPLQHTIVQRTSPRPFLRSQRWLRTSSGLLFSLGEFPVDVKAVGRPIANGHGNVVTVKGDDPLSTELIQDKDRNLAGQRWRFEGRQLKNDWNNCLVVYQGDLNSWLEQRPCDMVSYNYVTSWVYQDGKIKNERGYCLGVASDKNNRGDALAEEHCAEKLGQRWTLNGYMAPSPPTQVSQSSSGPLINEFSLAVTVKDNYKEGWQWLLQGPYQDLEGQNWFFDGHRIQNKLGFCLKSSKGWWIYQDDCSDTDAWYHIGNQLRNAKGCLGVHHNDDSDGAWLVVEQCDVSKLGQLWSFGRVVNG